MYSSLHLQRKPHATQTTQTITASQPRAAHSFEKYLIDRFCHMTSEERLKKQESTHLHTAVIVKRGKVIAEGTNQIGSRSSGSGYSCRTIHAEKAVVKDLGDIRKLRGADMYIFRAGKTREACGSQPCADCEAFLTKCMKEYGLRFVFYSA